MAKAIEIKTMRVGALEVEFLGANLGAVRFGGIEVLRGLSYLVRDENWGTVPARISGLKIIRNTSAIHVRYRSTATYESVKLAMQATLVVMPSGLTFTVSAMPDVPFKTCRTGFVVLHPAGVAGRPVTVTHTDGSTEKAKFPKLISPGQPFFEIRALDHAPAPGLQARVLMEGHKFEMEDQRNWTDASYKTYVCSLLDPWPYTLPADEAFEQKITLSITGKAPRQKMAKPAKITLKGKLPEIGFAVPATEAAATLKRAKEIKVLKPSHLMGQLDGTHDVAQLYAQIARETGVPMSLEIVLPARARADVEMAAMAAAVNDAGLKPESIVVTQAHDLKSFQPGTPRPWGPSYEEMAQAARQHFPGVKIGGGMISFFTELNRKRPPEGVFDFITHSLCPIVHDASDAAVMQTLESLPHIFASAKAFIGKTPYHLGPSTIGARMNPYGAEVARNPKNERICLAPNDPRQTTAFAVAWNKGLIAAAGKAGLKRLTLSAITGLQGLFDAKGKPTPLYRFFAGLPRKR